MERQRLKERKRFRSARNTCDLPEGCQVVASREFLGLKPGDQVADSHLKASCLSVGHLIARGYLTLVPWPGLVPMKRQVKQAVPAPMPVPTLVKSDPGPNMEPLSMANTKAEIRAALDLVGKEYSNTASKSELLELL